MRNLKFTTKTAIAAMCLLVAIIFCGCDSGLNGDRIPLGNRTIQTIEHDGCEYVYLRRYGSVSITHKGNCKFCAERSEYCRSSGLELQNFKSYTNAK